MTQPIEVGGQEWQSLVEQARRSETGNCWDLGDLAVQVSGDYSPQTAQDRLRRFAADTEISFPKLHRYRYVSLAWPLHTRKACSHRTHLLLATQPDRYGIIRDGMRADEAEQLVAARRQASGDPERTTLLSILASVTEAKHRLRVAFRDTMTIDPSDSQKEQILGGLAELETEAEQFRKYLTGMGLDEAIAEILEGTR